MTCLLQVMPVELGMSAKCRSDCPISLALEAFGDKWSLLILRDLLLRGRKHYREFLIAEERISTNILADRLTDLEELGIITKSSDPDNKKQYVYAPTKKGLDLLPILLELYRWSLKYDPRVDKAMPIARRLEKDTKGLIKEFRARFKKPTPARKSQMPKSTAFVA
jgi:DNA-binding HxlR family transcriptional regulator